LRKASQAVRLHNLWKVLTSHRSASFVLGSKKQSWQVGAAFLNKRIEAMKTSVLNSGLRV
jgi:hypothetical protein